MKKILKYIIDIAMCVLLMMLMSYQVMGEKAHELLGMAIFVIIIAHNFSHSESLQHSQPFIRGFRHSGIL